MVQEQPDAGAHHHRRSVRSAGHEGPAGRQANRTPTPTQASASAAGYAIDQRWGIDGNVFYIPTRSTSRSVASSGTAESTDLLLPFFDVTRNRENVTEVSFSPVYSGSATEELSNKLMGAELNATSVYRHGITMEHHVAGWIPLDAAQGNVHGHDQQLVHPAGSAGHLEHHRPVRGDQQFLRRAVRREGALRLRPLVCHRHLQARPRRDGAIGRHQSARSPPTTSPTTGRSRRSAADISRCPRTSAATAERCSRCCPSCSSTSGYRIAPTASIFLGYSFLYTNSVARPGNQMNRNINPTQSVSYVGEPPVSLQGPAQPTFGFNSSSFWAQGITAGLSIRF